MELYNKLITLLADVPVTTLSPFMKVCFNIATVAFFILLLRIMSVVTYKTIYSRISWGILLGIFVFGRSMTTMQLVLNKGLILSLEVSLGLGLLVAGLTYLVMPVFSKINKRFFKE